MAAPAADDANVLDRRKPLPESILWRLQDSFYDKINIRAWSEAIVPNFVTSNCYIANCYARVILGYIRDWFLRNEAADPARPVYIVEVGTGHGKLTFLLLRQLLAMREFWPHDGCFKYVMTDFTRHNLDYWATHEPLQPFFESGILDMAQWDAVRDKTMKLELSGEVLGASADASPIVVICNYVFDTLLQDAFRVVDGELQQALCTVISSQAEPDPTHPDVIRRIRCHWEYKPCTPEIYDDPHKQAVLRYYASHHKNVSVLLPLGGMGLIDSLSRMANGRMMLLAGDKAYNHEEELVGLRDPHVALHGSFSLMVNFHAVKLYVESRGGMARHTPFLDGFKCSSFVLGATHESTPEYRYAWADVMETFGPDNFSTLQRSIKDETPAPSLKNALAIMRLARYDSDVFYKFKQVLYDRAPYASEKQQADIQHDVLLMYENYYPLQRTKDIAFEVGRLFMTLKLYEQAVAFFEDSQRYCGEHHVSWYNMGICHNYTNDLDKALKCFNRSLELAPDYRDAEHWRDRIETRIRMERGVGEAPALPGGGGGGAGAGEGDGDGDGDAATNGHAGGGGGGGGDGGEGDADAGGAGDGAGGTADPEGVHVSVEGAAPDGARPASPGAAGGGGGGGGATAPR